MIPCRARRPRVPFAGRGVIMCAVQMVKSRLAGYATAAQRQGALLLVALLVTSAVVAVTFLAGRALGLVGESFTEGVIAVAGGLIATVPLALWLASVDRETAAARERQAAHARRLQVLDVLERELTETREAMTAGRVARPRELLLPGLRREAWTALSASGELRWIEDPELLGRLARAQHRIAETARLEDAWLRFETDPTRATIRYSGPSAGDRLRSILEDLDGDTIAAIDHALAGIQEARADGR
jgi:hypothetical protein